VSEYPCPCCGYLVFDEPPGSFDICPICFWEDDIVQLRFPQMGGGANTLSLHQSQQNYLEHGVSDLRFAGNVRKAKPLDVRDPDWRPFAPESDPHLKWDSQEDRERPKLDMPPLSLYYWRKDYWLSASLE